MTRTIMSESFVDRGGVAGRVPHFEFERILRVHSFVIHAFLTGRIAAGAEPAEFELPDSSGILRKQDFASTDKPRAHDEMLIRELIRSEALRAGVEPCPESMDFQRVEREVRAGGSWPRYRAILCQYQLSRPMVRALVEEPSQ